MCVFLNSCFCVRISSQPPSKILITIEGKRHLLKSAKIFDKWFIYTQYCPLPIQIWQCRMWFMTKKAFSSRPKDKLLLFYIHILCGLFFFLAYSHSELIKQLISVIFFLFCGHANVPYNLPHLSPLKSFPFDNIHRKFSWFLYFFFLWKSG